MPVVDKSGSMKYAAELAAISSIKAILAAALLILLIRWAYWLIRRREGIGLGDAKLMAMLPPGSACPAHCSPLGWAWC